ncbi:hypothetical protein ACFL6D_04625 [Spirochaetota bacterium]
MGNLLNGFSGRLWIIDKVAIEGNIFIGTLKIDPEGFISSDDAWNPVDLKVVLDGKFLYSIIMKENSKFYLGGELGVNVIGGDSTEAYLTFNSPKILMIAPFFGTEFGFSEMSEIKFNWEAGYRINMLFSEFVNIKLNGVFVSLGAHYYF